MTERSEVIGWLSTERSEVIGWLSRSVTAAPTRGEALA
jgi:hypothetical protein